MTEPPDLLALIELAATVAGATATVIGLISRPVWKKLSTMESSQADLRDSLAKMDQRVHQDASGLGTKLSQIHTTVDGIRTRVGEQNGRIGKLETWCQMHEAHDNERHDEQQDRRKELIGQVEGVRTDMQDLTETLRRDLKSELGALRSEHHRHPNQ